MQIVDILLLATVVLVLLGGLVSLGLGHRRWSIGTVVASVLVLLAASTYLYLAARLAARDRAWARKADDYRIRLAKAENDQTLDARGLLVPAERGPESLDRLREARDRWRRGRDRIETWHGRVWPGATFQPPKDDASTGRVELAAEANAEGSPPIGAGAHVFLFDAIPFEEGGAYIGEFLVQGVSYDQTGKRHVLTVVQTAPRDAYDAAVLARPHDAVTVFEDLPVDRWLAFYKSPTGSASAAGSPLPPDPVKDDADAVRELLASSPDVAALVNRFVESFERHDQEVPKDEWEAAAAEAAATPGTLWATVEFQKPFSFGEAGREPSRDAADAPADGEAVKRDFEPGSRAEFDLQTAVELRDRDGTVTIERVVRRRPLTDALTLLHGSKAVDGNAPDAGIDAEGAATLRRLLEAELEALKRSNDRLRAAQETAAANERDQRRVAGELTRDLQSWKRDAREAAALVAAFEPERDRVVEELRATEAAIVERGRELTDAMTRLARDIDRSAPPPERRAARP